MSSINIPHPNEQSPTDRRVSQYEFSDAQNKLFDDLAGTMGFVGVASIAVGLMGGAMGVMALLWSLDQGQGQIQGLGGILQGIVMTLTGLWIRNAATAFRKIAHTQGDDVSNLVDALTELKNAFALQRGLILVVGSLIALALGLGVVGLLTGTGTITVQ